MSQLSDIWGAKDKEESVVKPVSVDKMLDLNNPVDCMVLIHKKIVEMQVYYSDDDIEIDLQMLRATTGMIIDAWEAIIHLSTGYFNDRPANKRRMMMVAQKLSGMTVNDWLAISASRQKLVTQEEIYATSQ